MANRSKINTKDESLRELFGNGKKYTVPKFQRDYSWDSEHWQDLWDDMEAIGQQPEEYHYMGYLVLQETDGREMHCKIIDGQQRLTTFSLIVLAAIKKLREMDGEDERVEALRESFIGSKDLTWLRMENKLKLNRNNDYYYREAVNEKRVPHRGVKQTVRLMHEALKYFHGRFSGFHSGPDISRLIEQAANRLLFTTIYISDELSAYKIFETLNARGVKLSSADLLKNYLFSVIDSGEDTPDEVIDEWDEKWEMIGTHIGNRSYTEYIIAEWNSRHSLARKSELFKAIKKEIGGNIDKSKDYLDRLTDNSRLYTALRGSNDEFLKDHPGYKDIRKGVHFLRLFNIHQPISLLMAAYLHFENDFHNVLKWIEVLSLRYNVICRGHTGEQETIYSNICVEIVSGCNIGQVKRQLLTLYPDDRKFKQEFSDKTIPTRQSNRKARYLLGRLENFISQESIDETALTVEHILPLNPEQHWQENFGDDWQQFSQRLGNMALLPSGKNRDLGQEPFARKKEILLSSSYKINQSVEAYSDWTAKEIESRQSGLAEQAVKLWRID